MSPRRERPVRPPSPRPRGILGDRLILTSTLAFLVFGLGLIPFYFFTPAHDMMRGVVAPRATYQARTVPKATRAAGSTVVDTPPAATVVSVVAPDQPQTAVPLPTSSPDDSRFAFVLLGYGGGGHDGAYLTDSIMVVIVDPQRKSLSLLSVPRDSWVPLEFDGKTAVYNKVNTAYAFAKSSDLFPDRLPRYAGDKGPGTLTSDTLSRLLGIPIDYYLALDFQGFRDMIDAIGGVDVNVPDGFKARYPVNDDPSIDASWKVIQFEPGQQHMNGERAIEYARARETLDNLSEGSDFARSRRQRLIIEGFKTRMLQPAGLVQLPRLLGIASQHVDTNYALPAVTSLSQLILDWKDVQIYQTAITTDNFLQEGTGPDGTYLLIPSESEHSWAQIRAFTRRLWNDPAGGVAMGKTTVVIENDGASSGVANRLRANLIRLGYQLGSSVDGPTRQQSRLVDGTSGTGADLTTQLTKDLQGGALDVLPTTDATTGSLVIQLGLDADRFTISVPIDRTAPLSVVGVAKLGGGSTDPAQGTAPAPVQNPVAVVPPTSTIPPATPAPPTVTPVPVPPRATLGPVVNNSTTVIVPNLVGLPVNDAQRIINESDLMTTYVNFQTQNDVADKAFFQSIAPGAVLSESPAAGTKVPRGARIALAVRKQ